MYPAYRHTDSYPYHANPTFYAPSENPRTKDTDPRTLHSPCQLWPYGGNYHYPAPPEYHHGCCNHSYFAGPYSFQPPYLHYPPPPPPPCYPYPPFPATYPAYSVPAPQSDYDKRATHTPHRCCGCTHQEEDKKSRVEPEVDKKTNDSLVVKDHPYQVWIPPGYVKNTEPEVKHDPDSLSKQGGNDEPGQDRQGVDGYRFPFPIIWLPSKNNNEAGKNSKENNLSQVTRDEANEKEAESEVMNKHGVQKVIPVKQLETEEKNKSPKPKHDSVEKADNCIEGKHASKASKLPPVCLRIDPLPRKKNGSRSPSPPVNKERSKESPKETVKSSKQEIQVSEGLKKGNDDAKTGHMANETVVKKRLTEHEAALIIQSVYRGFEVRKSKPLMKLKQISEVKKQVVELRSRVQGLESSSCNIDKQKLVMGETIMSLLLKLDTIQGLHPVVRDIRKSVAKELVGLQEKLDMIKLVNSEPDQTVSFTEPFEESVVNENPGQAQTLVSENNEVEATKSWDLEEELNDDLIQRSGREGDMEDESHSEVAVERLSDDLIQRSDKERGLEDKNHSEVVVEELSDDLIQRSDKERDMEDETHSEVAMEQLSDGLIQGSDKGRDLEDKNHSEVAVEQLSEDLIQWSDKELDMEDKNHSEVAVEQLDDDLIQRSDKERDLEDKNPSEVAVKQLDDDLIQRSDKEHDMEDKNPSEVAVEELSDDRIQRSDKEREMENLNHSEVVTGSDRNLMEENERLKGAVEELMKAGNEQLGVITELTGRVKDLERKLLSKKKTKTKTKPRKRRSRGSVVQEELKSCVV